MEKSCSYILSIIDFGSWLIVSSYFSILRVDVHHESYFQLDSLAVSWTIIVHRLDAYRFNNSELV